MGKSRLFLEHIMEQTAFDSEVLPGLPIVEVVGEQRVLIENHQGIAAYGRDRILVNVKFGFICICGRNMEIRHMTREQLIIYGKIDSVGLQRRR